MSNWTENGDGWVRTDHQLRPHEGPTGIKAADRGWVSESPRHTLAFAVPANWTKDAACLDDWKAFAPPGDGREATRLVAKALCEECPVREICLETALEEEGTTPPAFRAGIRGGLPPGERYALAKARKLESDEPTCPSGHSRTEHGYHDGKRWRCDQCRREADARQVTCSCGRVGRRNTINVHKRRKGCA